MLKTIPDGCALIPSEARCVFRGVIFDVFQWQQTLFDGSTAIFEMLRRPDTVVIVVVRDGKVVLLHEEQPHHGKSTGVPCGRVDPGESSTLDAAKRELHEETGLTCAQWRLIDVRKPVEKIEWFIYTYVATDVVGEDAPHVDPGEKIATSLVDIAVITRPYAVKDIADCAPLRGVKTIEQLVAIPEFTGRQVDR